MTREQKQLLERHAEHFAAMASFIRECDDDELATLLEACKAANEGNCWWATHKAAKHLQQEIEYFYQIRDTERRVRLALNSSPP